MFLTSIELQLFKSKSIFGREFFDCIFSYCIETIKQLNRIQDFIPSTLFLFEKEIFSNLYRSLERLQANYCEYRVRKKAETKSSIYQQQNTTVDAQAYIRCRKHCQSIPVQIIASD